MPASKQAASSEEGCILLVEDNAGDVMLVQEALKSQSLAQELIVMRDGELAIHFIDEVDNRKAPCVNLVILDLNLPRRPGSDVLRRIRQSPVCGNVTVMVLSSSEAEKDKREMAALGANRYVRKPSSLAELVQLGAVVKEMLGSGTPS